MSTQKIQVRCTAPSGYRRANVRFDKGDNEVEVTAEQRKRIETDPFLTLVGEPSAAAKQAAAKKAPAAKSSAKEDA